MDILSKNPDSIWEHQTITDILIKIYYLKRTRKKLQNMKPLPKVFLQKSQELSKHNHIHEFPQESGRR